jgi:integrase
MVSDAAAEDIPAYQLSANGRWAYYDKGGKYNKGSLVVLTIISSLLRPSTGYLFQHAEYAEKLRARLTTTTWQQQCQHTRARVTSLFKQISRMEKENDYENFEFGRDPKELIQWILDLPRPLLVIHEMIKEMLEDLLPESAPMTDRARQYRNIVLIALLSSNPLRISMFAKMRFDRNLVRRGDGSWWLHFRRGAFKNRRALKGDYLVQVAAPLWPLLDRYKEEFHSFLTSATQSNFVFVSTGQGRHVKHGGYGLSVNGLTNIIHEMTEMFMPNGIGFRAHAFRHILATDIIKKDPRLGFFLAAIALHDKLETVEKEYIHLKTSEFFEPVNAHVNEIWQLAFASERATSMLPMRQTLPGS